MVLTWRTLLIEWRVGLDRAESAAADDSSPSAWYWTIRARILRYLVGRYEDQAGRFVPPACDERPVRPSRVGKALIDHPPKPRDEIASALAQLGDAAEEARVRRRGEPEDPWLWYRAWLRSHDTR